MKMCVPRMMYQKGYMSTVGILLLFCDVAERQMPMLFV